MHVIQTETVNVCPACGGSQSIFWCNAHDRLYHTTEQTFEYLVCTTCHTLYQSVRPLEAEVWKCYADTYGPHAAKAKLKPLFHLPSALNRSFQTLADWILGYGRFQAWIHDVEKNLVKAGDILDFGCGSGKYLDRARKLGCRTLGVDFSPKALEEVARRGHDTMPVSDATWEALKFRKLKFVRMNHVIEHLYDPSAVLRKIHAAMDSVGYLHISTPNPSGLSAMRYGNAWWGLECPRHIALIPPAQLEQMLKDAGFQLISTVQEPIAKDLLRSWAYQMVDKDRFTDVDVESLAGDGLLNLAFAFSIRRHLQKSGQSDRYHAVAIKAS